MIWYFVTIYKCNTVLRNLLVPTQLPIIIMLAKNVQFIIVNKIHAYFLYQSSYYCVFVIFFKLFF